jgi:UDP-glucose 4-epimerase
VVTGGAGFIGSNLVDALLARGDEVVVVDDLSSGKRENLAADARLVELDIRDPALAEAFAEARPEVCFHLAAQADVPTSVARPDFDAEVNVVGTVRVLEAAGDAHVVFSSTGGAVYGECERPAREDDPRRPLSPYGVAKLAGEEYLAAWNRLRGTSHTTLRFGNVYGPRQEAGLEGGVVAIFLDAMAAGEETTIFGDGRQTRDFVHVDDVVRALLLAPGTGGVFNVGSGIETSVAELHERCRAVAGDDSEPRQAPPREGDLTRSVLDVSLAERELGWRPELSLEEGLRGTWDWMRAG